jgi:hypothetical protein
MACWPESAWLTAHSNLLVLAIAHTVWLIWCDTTTSVLQLTCLASHTSSAALKMKDATPYLGRVKDNHYPVMCLPPATGMMENEQPM